MSSVRMVSGAERQLAADRSRTWEGRTQPRQFGQTSLILLTFCLCVTVIVASLLLGGGTRGGFLSDAILQLTAIPLLLVSLWRLCEVPLTAHMRLALIFCAAIAAIPIVQLIPLPPIIWTALPGREIVVEAFKLLDQDLPWMPISVLPTETWLSALSLIPPLAIFLGTLVLGYQDRRRLTLVFLGIGVVSVVIGLLQIAQGPESPLRFFEITNPKDAVGFFANRNHFASLLYAIFLFAAAWAIHALYRIGERPAAERFDTASIVATIGALLLLIVILAGEMMARSRGGLVLTMVAVFAAAALGAPARRVVSVVGPIKLIIGAGLVVLIFSSQFALYRLMARFAVSPLEDARVYLALNTMEAALAFMPFGSGLGTFVPVYRLFEDPKDVLLDMYANHAHNDMVELWLTTGVMGPVLLGMFVAWLLLRSIEIWRSPPAHEASELDWSLARAATIVVALLVVHSVFDYPLRTGAMMAVMAFSCALLIEPTVRATSWSLLPQGSSLKRALHGLLPDLTPARSSVLKQQTSAPLTTERLSDQSAPRKPAPPVGPTKPTPVPLPSSGPLDALPAEQRRGSDPLTKDAFIKGVRERLEAAADDRGLRRRGQETELLSDQSAPRKPAPPVGPTKPTPVPLPSSGLLDALPAEQRWGSDIEWPQEWSSQLKKGTSQEPPDDVQS
jgi:O-antigen ligase